MIFLGKQNFLHEQQKEARVLSPKVVNEKIAGVKANLSLIQRLLILNTYLIVVFVLRV